jgi:hypothetical protein
MGTKANTETIKDLDAELDIGGSGTLGIPDVVESPFVFPRITIRISNFLSANHRSILDDNKPHHSKHREIRHEQIHNSGFAK